MTLVSKSQSPRLVDKQVSPEGHPRVEKRTRRTRKTPVTKIVLRGESKEEFEIGSQSRIP